MTGIHYSSLRHSVKMKSQTNHGQQNKENDEESMVTKIAQEFGEMSLMHGIHFIANRKATIAERILWFLLFCSSFVFIFIFAGYLWEHWVKAPVLITIESAEYPIAKLNSFPTVTICSTNRISTRALEEWMASQGAGLGLIELEQVRRILKVISTNRVESEEEILTLAKLLEKSNLTSEDHNYEKLMEMLTPKCSDMMVYCSWEGIEQDCSNKRFFEQESTDDGYCCSFNSLITYKNGTNNKKAPVYASQAGVDAGMSIILNTQIEDYNISSSDTTGFKVSIQSPEDIPRTGNIGFLVSPGRQYDAAISGETQIAPSSIGDIPLSKRMCAMDEELKLHYFDSYTTAYCLVDCLATLLLQRCKCVLYMLPVPDELPVCNLTSYTCVMKTIEYRVTNVSACNCPDKCNQTWYRNEISMGLYPNPISEYPRSILKRPEFINMSSREFHQYAEINFAKLNIYFKSTIGVGGRTTWTDYIAATGGLLLLGFGFSLMSLAEVLYFTCVRWIYYFNLKRKKNPEEAPPTHHQLRRHQPLPNRDVHGRHVNDPEIGRIEGPHPQPHFNNKLDADPVHRSRNNVKDKDARHDDHYLD